MTRNEWKGRLKLIKRRGRRNLVLSRSRAKKRHGTRTRITSCDARVRGACVSSLFLYLFIGCIFSCRAVACASQNPPAQPSPMMGHRWNVEGTEIGWGPVGPFETQGGFVHGGGYQSDRLVATGGEWGEGSDEHELCGMQKDLTISQEVRTSR